MQFYSKWFLVSTFKVRRYPQELSRICGISLCNNLKVECLINTSSYNLSQILAQAEEVPGFVLWSYMGI